MNIFNRRNAMIGYLALMAMKRARRNATLGYLAAQSVEHTRARRRGRRALRLVGYGMLGVVSVGVLAGLVYFWRQRSAEITEAASGDVEAVADVVEDAVGGAGESESAPDGAPPIETAPAA